MEPGRSKWTLGDLNDAWEVQMELGRSKWSLIESYVISFNKNDVEMEHGTCKWSLGGPTGRWEVQMEPGKSKWSLGGSNGA